MRRSLDVRDARMKVPADEQQRVRFYFSLLFACRKRPSTHFELVYMFTFLRIDSSGTFLSLGQTPRVNRNLNACNFQFDFSIQNWSSESSSFEPIRVRTPDLAHLFTLFAPFYDDHRNHFSGFTEFAEVLRRTLQGLHRLTAQENQMSVLL